MKKEKRKEQMKYGSSHSHVAPRVEFHASKLISDILVQSNHLEAYIIEGSESSVGLTSGIQSLNL